MQKNVILGNVGTPTVNHVLKVNIAAHCWDPSIEIAFLITDLLLLGHFLQERKLLSSLIIHARLSPITPTTTYNYEEQLHRKNKGQLYVVLVVVFLSNILQCSVKNPFMISTPDC